MPFLLSIRKLPVLFIVLLGLSACGGSDGPSTGDLSIGLTDAPVEDAKSVVVAFKGLEFKPQDGPALAPVPMDENNCDDFDIATGTCYIDLLTLTGMNRRVVFNSTMAAGNYNWLRLLVEAELNVIDSYIEFDDGSICSLYIPSGAETGLKLNSGFIVTANGQSDYTLDFDVRTSVVAPPGQLAPALACQQNYFLKPSIRIVDTTQVGAIAGTVDTLVLQDDASCTLDGLGFYENVAVYVFENPTATAVGDDIDGGAQFPDPITSASVVWDNDPTVQAYTYEVGYLLAPENYQLALTCTADIDAIEVDDYDPAMPNASAFSFVDEQSVDVTVGGIADGSF